MAKKQNGNIHKETLAAIESNFLHIVSVSNKRHKVVKLVNALGKIGTLSMSATPSDRNAVKAQVRDVNRLAHKLAALAA